MDMQNDRRPSLSRAVDRAIAAENRAFLNDPAAIAEAEAEGDRMRKQLIREGQTWLAIEGDEAEAAYAARVAELEASGLTTSDAQAVADAEIMTGERSADPVADLQAAAGPYGPSAAEMRHAEDAALAIESREAGAIAVAAGTIRRAREAIRREKPRVSSEAEAATVEALEMAIFWAEAALAEEINWHGSVEGLRHLLREHDEPARWPGGHDEPSYGGER